MEHGRIRNLLLTGRPGCGKTTLIQRILSVVKRPRTGFFTREIRLGKRRVGFSILTLDGKEGLLAHEALTGCPRVGRYGVNLQDLERFVIPSLNTTDEETLIVMDEIGRMECLSLPFRKAVTAALDRKNPVLATVALRGDPFIQGIHKRDDVRVIHVDKANRDRVLEELMEEKWLIRASDSG
jgi:nucleoside-triphosphatase